jgi:hypothetical protein
LGRRKEGLESNIFKSVKRTNNSKRRGIKKTSEEKGTLMECENRFVGKRKDYFIDKKRR